MLPGAQEPIHCVSVYEEGQQLITGRIFSKVKLSLVISTTFEFPAKKWTPNYLKMAHFKLSQIENDNFKRAKLQF